MNPPVHGAEIDAVKLSSRWCSEASWDSAYGSYRCYHIGCLLQRIGIVLPRFLNGPDLLRESRYIEQICWRELRYKNQPIFNGCLPAFLMVEGDGYPVALSSPADPVELARRLAALEPSPPPAVSHTGTNIDTLARLLKLTPFESQWLVWSYCVRRFGRAILPLIPLGDDRHACEVLAVLCEVPVDMVSQAVSSRRLYAWGFLDDGGAEGAMPSMLSG